MYSIFHPKLKSRSRKTRARKSYRGSLLSAFPLHLMQWKLSLKDAKITSDYGLWGGGQMNNPHISCACRLSVAVWQREWHWRQGKTAFPVFIHPPLDAIESRMNNKWDRDGGRRSQSRKMARLKKNGELEGLFVFFLSKEQRILRKRQKKGGKEDSVVKTAFVRRSITLKKSQMSLLIFMNAHFIPRCSTERRDSCL